MNNLFGNLFDNLNNMAMAAQQQMQQQMQQQLPPFKGTYRCFPVVMANKSNLEAGDKSKQNKQNIEQLNTNSTNNTNMFVVRLVCLEYWSIGIFDCCVCILLKFISSVFTSKHIYLYCGLAFGYEIIVGFGWIWWICILINLLIPSIVILPSSALDHLARLRVTYPMMFELVNRSNGHKTHCGVMEFSAEEGVCYLPYWMMQNLLLESGGIIDVYNVALPKGTFVQLQPHTTKFTQLHNPRVVLERALRNFSCLTQGDTISIQYGEQNYFLDIVEVKPGTAISIIETDVNVDFAPPKDFNQYQAQAEQHKQTKLEAQAHSTGRAAELQALDEHFTFHGTADTAQSSFFDSGTHALDTSSTAKSTSVSGTNLSATSTSSSTVSPTGPTGTSCPSTPTTSSYFAKLGAGHKLTSKKSSKANATASTASTASTATALASTSSPAPSSSSSSSAQSPSPSASSFTSTSSSLPSAPGSGGNGSAGASAGASVSISSVSRPSSARVLIESSADGKFDYHYSIDAAGNKRLMKRTPKSTSSRSSSSSTGSSFKPFAGKGNVVANNK